MNHILFSDVKILTKAPILCYSYSPIYVNGILKKLMMAFPIYLIFKSEGEKFVYTRCGVLKNFQKEDPTRYISRLGYSSNFTQPNLNCPIK